MSLSPSTAEAIHAYLLSQLTRYLQENAARKPALETKPFHARLLPALFAAPLSERSFSTRSGSWFQEIARLVAHQYHNESQCGCTLQGHIQPAASNHIEAILHQMDKGIPKRVPNREQDIREVLTVQSPNGAALAVTADLFVQTRGGTELYFEMKTPDPNKGQCLAMKRFILQTMALRKGHDARALASAAYNPCGDGQPYKKNYVGQFLEVGTDILVGRQFWSLIGEQCTFDELLDIAAQVGKTVEPMLAKS
jgi:hypothetical protein